MQKPVEDDEGIEDSTDSGSDSESDTDRTDDDTQYASVRGCVVKSPISVFIDPSVFIVSQLSQYCYFLIVVVILL
jgi:hypothetical protein